MRINKLSELKIVHFCRKLIIGIVLATSLTVSGCSLLPDAANPIKWFDNTLDYFIGDDAEGLGASYAKKKLGTLQADRGTPPPGEDKPSPNLGSFPKGLSGDRSGRKYASAPIVRQGEVANRSKTRSVTPIAKKVTIPSEPPAPPAIPIAPVQQAQIASAPPAPLAIKSQRLTSPTSMASGSVRNAFNKGMTKMVPNKPQKEMKVSDIFSDFSINPLGTVIISSVGVEVLGSPLVSASKVRTSPITRRFSQSFRKKSSPNLGVKNIPLIGRVKVATIIFKNGSARLTGKDLRILQDVLKLKRQKNGQRIVVVGHASSRTNNMDPVRHKIVNFQISVSRADVVAKELARLGLKSDELSIDAVSDTEPAYFEIMPSGEAGNRRAEVFIDFSA